MPRAVHAPVAFLLDHLPPALHLVIAGREDPRRQLVEVRAADLGFSVEEAAALLGSGMALRLADARVAALVERTEGWAAGLQLAGLAGPLVDQAALFGLLARLRDLGATVLLVERLTEEPDEPAGSGPDASCRSRPAPPGPVPYDQGHASSPVIVGGRGR